MGCWTPPFGNPQVLAGAVNLAELLAACAAGASVPLGKARARARSPRPPHLHRFVWGLAPPGPLRSPLGKACRSCAFGGFAPLPPRFPNGDVCRSCAPVGGWRPLAPAFPKGEARRSCAPAHGIASDKACGQRPRKSPGSSCREAARSSVTPLARLWRSHSSATASGESQRGRSPLWPVFAYFLLARK